MEGKSGDEVNPHLIITGCDAGYGRWAEGLPPRASQNFFSGTSSKRDRDAIRSAVSSDAAYVAFIGSRRKAEKLKADLLAEGMVAEKLEALHSPAGLDIGAVTPDEIALSILAEIVQVRRKADTGSIKSVVRGTSASTG